MRYAILALILGILVWGIRMAVYGFDFGMIQVWYGTLDMDWARATLDFVSGALMGGSSAAIWLLK